MNVLHPWLRRAGAAAILYLLLVQPNHPLAMTWGALAVLPLELPVILLALMAVPEGRSTRILRAGIVGAIGIIATLKAADFAMFVALGRGFNPVSDLPLVAAGLRFAAGAVGQVPAALAVVAAGTALAGVLAALWWATGVWAAIALPRGWRWGAGGGAVLAAALAVAEIGQATGRWGLPATLPGAAFTARVGVERVDMVVRTIRNLRAFNAAAATDDFADVPGLLSGIDRDVLVIFVESYGRTSFDTPFYAGLHRATLSASQDELARAGLAMRSTFLEAPTRGGQSWLSHATFSTGLRIDNQVSYGSALASARRSLFHLAAEAGFHTAAVMPQITLDWPEAAFMGFETVLAAADLGYRGQPFNWVTMPDQFTLAALERRLLTPDRTRPVFVQVALGSSHAPWVPVPELLDWDALGDGRVFDAMATAGDPPKVVWRDHERVRAQYRVAVDYALGTVMSFVLRHAESAPLILVVGDHQAAEFVALDDRWDVPIHAIGPAPLMAAFAADGWAEGLLPPDDTVARPMESMRNFLLRSFSAVPEKQTES